MWVGIRLYFWDIHDRSKFNLPHPQLSINLKLLLIVYKFSNRDRSLECVETALPAAMRYSLIHQSYIDDKSQVLLGIWSSNVRSN